MIEGSGSGSIPLTIRSGSGSIRPKKMWLGGTGSGTLLSREMGGFVGRWVAKLRD
jgi:hypothetical protein